MSTTIRVQPAARLRQEFALWGTSQHPKIHTVAPNTFAVPAGLYTEIPEPLLIGALVDGQRYVSPDEQEPTVAPVTGEQWAEPGQPLPEVPESAYGPDSVPLTVEFAPLEDAPADSDPSDSDAGTTAGGSVLPEPEPGEASAPAEEFTDNPCPGCDRSFTTARGRDTHFRIAHAEES
ncbi:hypothetical protein [Streptomyces sp. NBC_00425]|uniref:hypothetical protein n=1 Tax=Streptomyces sp. NBC_00425 TaxID=2975740 RepID=UPI002E22A69D